MGGKGRSFHRSDCVSDHLTFIMPAQSLPHARMLIAFDSKDYNKCDGAATAHTDRYAPRHTTKSQWIVVVLVVLSRLPFALLVP